MATVSARACAKGRFAACSADRRGGRRWRAGRLWRARGGAASASRRRIARRRRALRAPPHRTLRSAHPPPSRRLAGQAHIPRRRSDSGTPSPPISPRTCSNALACAGSAPLGDVYARAERTSDAFNVPKTVERRCSAWSASRRRRKRRQSVVEPRIEGSSSSRSTPTCNRLSQSAAHDTLHIGDGVTRGLGSGSTRTLAAGGAEEYDRIKHCCAAPTWSSSRRGRRRHGTGAAPIVARIARELGALTVGIVTRPFQSRDHAVATRQRVARSARGRGRHADRRPQQPAPDRARPQHVDGRAFRVADDVLRPGRPGHLRPRDAARVDQPRTSPTCGTIMSEAGNALLASGWAPASGARSTRPSKRWLRHCSRRAWRSALDPALDHRRSRPLAVGGQRVGQGARAAHPDANIIFGAMVDDKLDDQVWVTVVATGYGDGRPRRRDEERPGLRDRPTVSALDAREPAGEPRVSRARPPPARAWDSSPMSSTSRNSSRKR